MILVTGSAGLLGRELMHQLTARGLPVLGIDCRNPAESGAAANNLTGDLLDQAACRRACAGVEVVVHTAARQHHSDPPRWGRRRFFAANIEMTRNLTAASLEAGVRQFIFISSDMVYGVPKGRPFRETDVPRPIGPYGWSKLESEVVCLAARDRGMRVTVLRPRLIIGPGRLGVLQRLFDCVRTGRSVPMLGDGSNRYQMVAVSDVAAACVRAILQPRDGVFNLGSADPPPVRRLLAELCERAGSRSSIKALPLGLATSALWALHLIRLAPLNPEQFRIAGVDYVLDTSKAHAELGWEPRLSDADMLWSAYETYVQRVAPVGPTAALSRA